MDPVMISESGYDLLQKEAHDLLVTALFPRADVLTPNIHEAERLTGQSIQTIEDMKTAARQLLKMGPSHVVVKGGHATKTPGVDILATGQDVVTLSPRVVSAANFHGTGCTFSSAIAANIAMGSPVEQAVKKAKEYISLTIERAFHIGRGHPVLGHFPDTGH
jgi:hydroxymethylpyrimidine/phosphomethylpyrimidine kinase